MRVDKENGMNLAETIKLRARQIKDDGPQGNRVLNVELQLIDDLELTLVSSDESSSEERVPDYFEVNTR